MSNEIQNNEITKKTKHHICNPDFRFYKKNTIYTYIRKRGPTAQLTPLSRRNNQNAHMMIVIMKIINAS